MTTLAAPATRMTSERRSKLAWAAADSVAVAKRNVIVMTRPPQILAFASIQPVLFVLMFRYVFGGSIHIPGRSYVDYLMAGIFVQTMMLGIQGTAVGMAADLHNGLIEGFRSRAMSSSAVLAGRVLADALRNVLVVVLMLGVAYLVGFRLHTNVVALFGAMGILLLFGFAMSWVAASHAIAAVIWCVAPPGSTWPAAPPVSHGLVARDAGGAALRPGGWSGGPGCSAQRDFH